MDILAVFFGLIGGLALFLFGIHFLSEGLQKAAGDKLKNLLEKLTKNRLRGAGAGALVTATIQSSSLTTVTLIGLINAGLMSFEQSVPVIMGANIGTTITAQIVAFKVGMLAMPVIAIGFLLYMLKKKRKYSYVGQIILGFGLLFLGMNFMSQGVAPLKESQYFIILLADFGALPILGILAGAVFTAIVQSSSATTALVISMGMGNIITLPAAIALILGANIGTCVTALLASIGASLSAKRAALSHVLINVIGVLIFFPFIAYFAQFVAMTSADLPRQIANAHTIFNVAMVAILLPFTGALVLLVKKILRGEEIRVDRGTRFLDERTLDTPSIALDLAARDTNRMAKIALGMLRNSEKALVGSDRRLIISIKKSEEAVDEIDNAIEVYLTKIAERNLSKKQSNKVATLLHNISDVERVADHAHNIAELAERNKEEGIRFSRQAKKELDLIFKKTLQSYAFAIKVMETRDKKLVQKVLDLEMEIDQIEKDLEKAHFIRLRKGICKPQAGPIYLDVIRNLERISDHAHNIAYAVLIGF